MALTLETIRASADRVAASHGLEIVEIEFSGGSKHRTLRIFLEKDEAGRALLAKQATEGSGDPLPSGVAIEQLSGVTHEDCASFARDFGTLLDVEDLVPGSEYTLEVSSPGLERKLRGPADYQRFCGNLVKLQTYTPVDNNRHFTGRLVSFAGDNLTLDLSAIKVKGKAKRAAASTLQTVVIPTGNVEKANLVAEI